MRRCDSPEMEERVRIVTVDEYWKKLEKIGWAEYLPRKKLGEIREHLHTLLADKGPKIGFYALGVTGFDVECIYEDDDYRKILTDLAEASGGVFAPTNIKVKLDGAIGVGQISFKHGSKLFSREIPFTADWFQMEVLDLVNDALAATKAKPRFIPLPTDTGQIMLLGFVPPEIYEKAFKAKLIPPTEDSYLADLLAREKEPKEVERKRRKRLDSKLRSKDEWERSYAIGQLGETTEKAKRAFPVLVEALKDKSSVVRQQAAETMVRIGSKAVPFLETAIKDPDAIMRLHVATSLWKIAKHPQSWPTLLKVLREGTPEQRNYAEAMVDQMSLPKGETAVTLMTELLRSPGWTESVFALLKEQGAQLKQFVPFFLRTLRGLKEKDVLPEIAGDDPADWRAQGAWAFHWLGPIARDAIPELLPFLQDSSNVVRRGVLYALSGIGEASPVVLNALTEMIKNEKEDGNREEAIEILNKLKKNS